MDEIILMTILFFAIAIPIAFCIWLVYILYTIPKRNGQKKTGVILSSLVGLFFIYMAINIFFEDELFSKNDVRGLLKEQNIILTDDFEILENKSMSAIGEYYHTFTLKISDNDKSKIVAEIKKSDNFKTVQDTIVDITQLTDHYTGKTVSQNYETENQLIRKYFKPEGKGYAPTYQVVTIEKNKNEIIFEDIDE